MSKVSLTKPRVNQRAIIWQLLRKHKSLKVAQLFAAKVSKPVADSYLNLLQKGGFVTTNGVNGRLGSVYTLVKDVGVDAPRFGENGELIGQTGTELMWRTMRILNSFTRKDLVAHCTGAAIQLSASTINNYTRHLTNASYLKVVGKVQNNKSGNAEHVLQLVKNTGPKPPQILKIKEVYDPNLDEIMYREVPEYE